MLILRLSRGALFELQQDLQYYLDTLLLILIYLPRESGRNFPSPNFRRNLFEIWLLCYALTVTGPITIVKLNYDIYNGRRMIPPDLYISIWNAWMFYNDILSPDATFTMHREIKIRCTTVIFILMLQKLILL